MKRCPWSDSDDLYRAYHDLEWGTPVHDETRHFEFLLLETMQAGLSWHLILSRRGAFSEAFDRYDWKKVMGYDEARIEALMDAPLIIHNRLKLKGAVKNAMAFERVRGEYGSFDAYIWSFTHGLPLANRWEEPADVPARTELSDLVAADMKRRGFSFVGSVTTYSHLQAIGVVNDHLVSCFRHGELAPS